MFAVCHYVSGGQVDAQPSLWIVATCVHQIMTSFMGFLPQGVKSNGSSGPRHAYQVQLCAKHAVELNEALMGDYDTGRICTVLGVPVFLLTKI